MTEIGKNSERKHMEEEERAMSFVYESEGTYSVSNHDMRAGIISTEVQAHFHAGIAATNNQNPLVSEIRPGLIHTGMNNPSTEPLKAQNFRY